MNRHPKQRQLERGELMPNVHWAQIQRALRSPGNTRAIYDFELMYVFRGELLVHFSDADENVSVEAGDLLLIPSAIRHRIEILTEPDSKLLGIHFDFFNELSTLAEQDIVIREDKRHPERVCSMPVTPEGTPAFGLLYRSVPFEIVERMERIVTEHGRSRAVPGYDLACRGLMLLIFAELLNLHEPANRFELHPQYRAAMLELAAEMDMNPGGPWLNATMAARFNVSEDHFIRLFKDIVGTSPHKHIQFLRHRDARKLLRETDMKIELIGRRLGYEDLHNFSKVFKKWQGVSPRTYRKLSIMH